MKKYFAIFSFLILSSTVFATPVGGSIGGWQVVSNVASGIGAKITATKEVLVNGAKTTVTGTANIMPNPSNMGKFMVRLGGAALVSEALNQILDGVDYVMDPANNTVTYKPKPLDPVNNPSVKYLWSMGGGAPENFQFSSATTAGQAMCAYKNETFQKLWNNSGTTSYVRCITKEGSNDDWNVYAKSNPLYDPTYVDESDKPKTVELTSVASQAINQAEEDIRAGNPSSPAVALSRAVAQDMAAEAETDDVKARPIANQFEQTQSIPTDEDATGTIDTPEVVDPVTGEVVKPSESASISMKWPKACEWFPSLCLFIDWMQKPHELDEPDLPTKEIEKKEIDEELIKISSSSCPAPIDVNIPLPVFNTTYTDSISVSEYCPKIEKLAPVLQLLAFVLAIMIIKDI